MVRERLVVTWRTASGTRGLTLRILRSRDHAVELRIDISRYGHSPAFCERRDGSLSLVCVGHLYTRTAKSFSLEESLGLLLDAYIRSGIGGMRSAIGGGMFSLFVIDREAMRLFALTDFLASMPLYYRGLQGGLLLGINQFDVAEGAKPSLPACAEYLTYGYLPFQSSLFPEVGRVGPGQVLSLSLDEPEKLECSEESLPSYPELSSRITDENEAIELLDGLFSAFFGRLGDEPLAAGLSGGYDSRLIAAYCRKKRMRLVTSDNPQTNEARFAQRAAEAIGLSTEVFRIPSEAPTRFADDFLYGTMTANSLESSHIYGNLEELRRESPSFILDGHIGDVVVGGGFYCKLKLSGESPLGVIAGQDRYSGPPLPDEAYLRRMSSGYGKKITGLHEEIASQVESSAKAGLVRLIDRYRPISRTDADLMEMILYRFRASLFTSGGPVAFLRKTQTLCPFYDEELFSACMGISKALRAGDRLYNAFYRRRFPELSHVPKESSGGWPAQGVVGYRLAHLRSALCRKALKRLPAWMQKGGKGGGDMDWYVDRYTRDGANRAFFGDAFASSTELLGSLGMSLISSETASHESPLLYLRCASLGCLVGEITPRA